MNKYIIQNDESGKQWAVGPVLKIKPFLSAYIDSKGRISDRYEFDMDDWFSYLIQLPRFEWQGEKREVGDVVELGKDFVFEGGEQKYEGLSGFSGKHYHITPIIAIPLSKAEEELTQYPITLKGEIKAEEVKPYCSGHKKDLFGRTDMKEVAEAIGDLHYETLHDLFAKLCEKFEADAIKDNKAGRDELGNELFHASEICDQLTIPLYKAWKISQPFMKS